MMTPVERLGFVYVLRRADLNKCYVGQSINTGRPLSHLKPGRYQYDELCGDGGVPLIEIIDQAIPRGDELDKAESSWMRTLAAEGWTVINKMGPDAKWPKVSPEASSLVGKKYGPISGRALADRRAADPEFAAWWHEHAAKAGNAAMRARRAADPEFDARMREAEARGGRIGAERRRELRASDSEWAARQREAARRGGLAGGRNGGLATAKMQRTCVECGLGPTTPGGLGFHQSRTGHAGFVALLIGEVDHAE